MDVISLVGIVAALFIVISLSEPLADWLRLPYTVVLAIIGVLIGIGAASLSSDTAISDQRSAHRSAGRRRTP
jgi:CPA1 family monovalent cation:H+ antiporter